MTRPPEARFPLPVIGFVAPSGTGKTTLLSKLLPLLQQQGLRVGVIKNTHHDFDIDQPGKDSYVLRKAGACQMLLCSPQRTAIVLEHPQAGEPQLQAQLAHLDLTELDLVLVEGFKHTSYPKVLLDRATNGPWPDCRDADYIAVASDRKPPAPLPLPLLDINRPEQIAQFLCQRIALQ